MKQYMIKYNTDEVVSIGEAPTSGAIVSGTPYVIETLDNAKIMLSNIGIDITKLEEYKPIRDNYKQQ
jgi:hypothetical protein